MNSGDNFKVIVIGNDNHIFATKSDLALLNKHLSYVWSWLDLDAAEYFTSFEIILQDSFLSSKDEFIFFITAENLLDLHLIWKS